MALWAMMASPMLVSADFRKMPASSKAILLNKYVISINQDPLGVQGRRIKEVRRRREGGKNNSEHLNFAFRSPLLYSRLAIKTNILKYVSQRV